MSPRQKRPFAGQPPTDIAWRLRNWCWYWMVKYAAALSSDQLDVRYLPAVKSGSRPRFFERVRTIGSDPSRKRKDLGGKSVFDVVHQRSERGHYQLEPARRLFQSKLWEMLSNKDFSADARREVIAATLDQRGWYRVRSEDFLLSIDFSLDDPSYNIGREVSDAYRAMLSDLQTMYSANGVALLAAMYREAVADLALEKAVLLEEALRKCTSAWSEAFQWTPEIRGLLCKLVDERIIRNVWTDRAAEVQRSANLSQRRFADALVKAHLAAEPRFDLPGAHMPIVRRSTRTDWIESNRATFAEFRRRLHEVSSAYDREHRDGFRPDEAELETHRRWLQKAIKKLNSKPKSKSIQ